MIYKPNFFVITGGPGVGKTTLLEALAKQGFPYVPEVAREIIREQVARNGNALPWANIPAYTHLMLSRSVESFEQHQKQESVLFFDRGIPDTDSERKQTYQEAVETYDVMLVTYQQLDYIPIIVPKGTPEERAEFVISVLKKHTTNRP